jgi:hypothetical protein
VGIKGGLQEENLGGVGHGCFVRIEQLSGEGLDLTSRAVSSAALVASCDFGMLYVRLHRICLDSPLVGYSMQSTGAGIVDYCLYLVRGVALQ